LLQRHDFVCLLARDMARISDVQVEFRERVSTSSASIKREADEIQQDDTDCGCEPI